MKQSDLVIYILSNNCSLKYKTVAFITFISNLTIPTKLPSYLFQNSCDFIWKMLTNKVYGLFIQSFVHYLYMHYGEDKLVTIQKRTGINFECIFFQQTYPQKYLLKVVVETSDILGKPYDAIMYEWGGSFVEFMMESGYKTLLNTLGHTLVDFLNGLNNLHDYLKYKYKYMKRPFFFCNQETKLGITLHYWSTRHGFLHFVRGQIECVAWQIFKIKITSLILHIEKNKSSSYSVMRLTFDNSAHKMGVNKALSNKKLSSETFLSLFPFHLIIDHNWIIQSMGSSLNLALPQIMHKNLKQAFTFKNMHFDSAGRNILMYSSSWFEMESRDKVKINYNDADLNKQQKISDFIQLLTCGMANSAKSLTLQGQIFQIKEWNCIMILATPVIESLEHIFQLNLSFADFSNFDWCRENIAYNFQPVNELHRALQEMKKTYLAETEKLMELQVDMTETEDLLYKMLPLSVATTLRRGKGPLNTCVTYENVTIMFSDVVGFTTICSRLDAMGVVELLNTMYCLFDALSENYDVYKVQTIGDGYMVVSGAPKLNVFHAINMCNFSLDLLTNMELLTDPVTNTTLQIRIGIHSGSTVAGVIGIKMPRYCFFGDDVHTASRMEANGQPMKIHISETTKNELKNYPYIVEERGTINIGKIGSLKTYWLLNRMDNDQISQVRGLSFSSKVLSSKYSGSSVLS